MTGTLQGPSPHRRSRRLHQWAGHRAPWLYAALAVPSGLCSPWLHGTASAFSAVLTLAAALWLLGVQSHHNRRLCERCVASVPLDPQRAVRRRRPALRLMHWLANDPGWWSRYARGLSLKLYLLLVADSLVSMLLPHDSPEAKTALWAPVGLFMIAVMFVARTHQLLQPWCPRCRWGDGGAHEHTPVPDPGAFQPQPAA